MAETNHLETEELVFVCDQCGECCRHIEPLIEIWPYQVDGTCIFLKGNLCSIYEERPDLCDFKRAYPLLQSHMTENEYLQRTIQECERLKIFNQENLHES